MNQNLLQRDRTKSEQLFRTLYDSIRYGELPNGARLATETELARKYDCSRITVRSSLRQLEELRLIRRIRGNGTYVSSDGVRFSNRRRIAVVACAIRSGEDGEIDPFFSQLMMGLFQHGNTLDFSPSFIVIPPEETSFMRAFEQQNINLDDFDGLIFAKQLSHDEIAALEGGRRSFLALQPPAGNEEISYATIDNHSGAYVATRHLLECGRRNLVFLHGPLSEKVNAERVAGFLQALGEFGITGKCNQRHYEIPTLTKEASASELIRRLLAEGQSFDGLLVHGDWSTYGAVNVLRETGLRIPQDVSLVMYDDFAGVQRMLKLRITSVRQPFTEQIRAALHILLRQLDNPGGSKTIQLIQPMLMIRETT